MPMATSAAGGRKGDVQLEARVMGDRVQRLEMFDEPALSRDLDCLCIVQFNNDCERADVEK